MPSWSETIQDYNGETSVTGLNVGAVTAISLPGLLSDIADYRAAIDDLILGTVKSDQLVAYKTPGTNALPADPNAQVERKWLGRYHDTVTQKKYRFEIPTAELVTGRLLANSDFADLTDTNMAAFKTWFDGFARSPDSDVNAVVLDSMQHVGRNI